MGKTVAITGVNSYFASTLPPKLQEDKTVDRIIGISGKYVGKFSLCYPRFSFR